MGTIPRNATETLRALLDRHLTINESAIRRGFNNGATDVEIAQTLCSQIYYVAHYYANQSVGSKYIPIQHIIKTIRDYVEEKTGIVLTQEAVSQVIL